MSKGASQTQNFKVIKAEDMVSEVKEDIDLVCSADQHPAASLLNAATKMGPVWVLDSSWS